MFYVINGVTVPFSNFEIVQIGLVIIAAATLAIAIYFLSRSYWNFKYGYLPTPKQLLEWRDELVQHYSQYQPEKAQAEIDEIVARQMLRDYAENAHINVVNNDTKSAFLHKANRFIVYSVTLALAVGVISVVDSFGREEKVHSVRVVK